MLNNPLSYTDPSGFFFSSIFKAIGNFFSAIFKAIGSVFKAILNVPILREVIQIVACAASTIACGITSGLIALASGGSIVDALKAMAISFANIGVWTGVGSLITGPLQGLIGAGPLFALAKGGIHGVIGGAMSLAQGGNFLQGFAANAIGAATGAFSDVVSKGNILLDTMIVAAAGGVAAELSGGKFANGALTAAFANLYNKWGQERRANELLEKYLKQAPPGFNLKNAVAHAEKIKNDYWFFRGIRQRNCIQGNVSHCRRV